MILSDFYLETRANKVWYESGIDSIEECIDKDYFTSYPYEVEYKFNSRGYRDDEWNDDISTLKDAVWCLGDSFTVGMGVPYDKMWVKVLEKLTKKRTINVSLDGSSNEWIVRRCLRLIEEIEPKYIVIHWSYFDRRESSNVDLSDEERRIKLLTVADYEKNEHIKQLPIHFKNLLMCVKKIEELNYKGVIIHSIIHDEINSYDKKIQYFIHRTLKSFTSYYISDIEKVDYARDGLHYGIKTSENFARKISNLIV